MLFVQTFLIEWLGDEKAQEVLKMLKANNEGISQTLS